MFPRVRINGVTIFRSKGQRSRSRGVRNLHSNLASCLLTAGWTAWLGISKHHTTHSN